MAQYREGQRLKGSDGNVYVVQNGVPVLAGPTALTGVDPTIAPKVTKAQNEATASASEPAKASADATRAQYEAKIAEAQAQVAAARNDTDLKIAQANLAKTQAEIANLNTGKGHAIGALQQQLDRVGELYRQKIQGGLPNPLWGHVPTSTNEQFDTAAQGLVNPFQAAFRIPGVGAQSDTELKQFIQANTPTAHDTDLQIQEKMRNIQTRIDAEKGTQPAIAPDAAQTPEVGLTKGKTRAEVDPALKAVASKVGVMLSNGTSGTKIEQFLRDNGVDPATTDLNAKLQYRQKPDFKTWQRANPGKPYPIDPSFYTKQVQMTKLRKMVNDVAQSPVGAFNAAAANAVSGGRLDDAVGATGGDRGMAQTGMEMLRTNHPLASLGGDIAGQVLFEDTLGRIPGARGLMATRMGRRGADALYGAYSGSGEDNEDPLGGALTGAVTNAGFGMLGRSAQRGVGRGLTGVQNKALQYLDNRGVPLTLGQIGRGSQNAVGKTVGGLEERLMGLPGFDAVIGRARQRGDRGFNAAAFREMGGTGATGAAGIAEGKGLVDNSYNFLNNANIPLDAQFAGSQAAVRSAVPALPAFGPELDKSLNVIDKAANGGALSGRDWQSALRAAKSDRSSIRGKEFAQGAHDLLGDVETNLTDLAARQGPPDTVQNLINANKLNTKFKTLASALDNGPAQKAEEIFSAGRLDDASRVNTRKYGGQIASLSGYRPFYDLTTAGKEVMPNLTPDSGTAGRMLLAPVLAATGGAGIGALGGGDNRSEGAELGAGYGASLGALAAGVYSKPAQQIIQRALLGDRNPAVQRLGNYLISRAKIAGYIGSGLGRDYVYQPELPQQ